MNEKHVLQLHIYEFIELRLNDQNQNDLSTRHWCLEDKKKSQI